MREIKTDILQGDCLDVLRNFANDTFDLIVTSPPYADSRAKTYGGKKPDRYVQWVLPISLELLRVLKPNGTFILNIKEKAANGERHTYVLELILKMKEQGWLWTEEYIWHKKNSPPGKWPNRFRDSWERLLQFNKSRAFSMYQDAVKVPRGEWANSRLKNLSSKDKVRDTSQVGSGFGKRVANWTNREMVYPTNVLHMATECGNKEHSAVFPIALPMWFIKLFTAEGGRVLDPFMGSGTTGVAAKQLNRQFVGIEIRPDYHALALQKINSTSIDTTARGNHETTKRKSEANRRISSASSRKYGSMPKKWTERLVSARRVKRLKLSRAAATTG